MSSAQKSLEAQCKVKRNTEEIKNQLNDLYNWEKEIKQKELDLKRLPSDNEKPIENLRSTRLQIIENTDTIVKDDNKNVNAEASSKASSPMEKSDVLLDETEQRHKKANEMKDRGNNFVKLQKIDEAIVAYTAAINIYNDDPAYFSNRALCYLKKESYDACIDDCDSAIDIDKLCVKAYYRRMQANESLGNDMDALKDCTSVLTIEPKNPEAKQSLQRINDRLRRNAPVSHGPNFSTAREDMIDVLPTEKPVYKRSKNPLRRVPIADVVVPKTVAGASTQLTISDEDIDKLFNSNCGPFEEVKKTVATKSAESVNKLSTESPTEDKKQPAITNIPKPNIQAIPREKVLPKLQKIPIPELPLKKKQQKVQHLQKEKDALAAQEQQPKPKNDVEMRPLPPVPTSTAQFYTHWKELTPLQKYKWLKSIEVAKLCKILGAGFDSDTLTSLVDTLHNYYVPNKEPTLAKTLLEISKNLQVSILSMLMSSDEKKVLNEIVEFLKSSLGADDAVVKSICSNFSLR